MATYAANKRNTANITHIFWYDASVPAYSPNLMHAALPYNLLPVVPAVGDIVYFGINTAWADSGPFCSLVFDIGTAQVDLTITWEYWNGGWVALTRQDNTNANGAMTGQAFDTTGENSVHWVQPDDWLTTTVNGITGYWVRARVTAIGAAPSPPTQQNRDVYSITWPYVEIQMGIIGGDIPALAKALITNQSDADASNDPKLWTNRIIAGLRSMSRGENFTAYINLADEQNPTNVNVGVGGFSAFANDVTTASGRRITITNHLGPYSEEAGVDFLNPLAAEYQGVYHLYVRGEQTSGASGDISLRVRYGFGPYERLGATDEVIFENTNAWQLLDFGKIELAPRAEMGDYNLYSLTISIQASGDGAADVNLYDLILIPVDEWAIDAVATSLANVTCIGDKEGGGRYLAIDGIYPKKHMAVVCDAVNDILYSYYLHMAAGGMILQQEAKQRLWFLTVRYPTTPIEQRSEPWVAHSVQLFDSARYLTMRGAR